MYYIGIDIGGTGIKAGIVDKGGKILSKDSVQTNVKEGYKAIAKDIFELIEKIIKAASIGIDDIYSVGIGCPGSIDDKRGEVIYSNNLEFKNAPICDEIKKYIDKPIYINNDANCAALGEFFALDDDSITDFVAITLGTGVGSGIIINKKLFTGSNGVAGELGHTVLVMNGEPCNCGRLGCWESYASATALIRQTERAAQSNPDSYLAKLVEQNGGKANGKIPWDAMQAGDDVGKEVVCNYIKYVAEGITNIVNIFQPQVVAIGGGVSNQGDNLTVPIKEYIKDKCYGAGLVEPAKVVTAKLGNDAGIIGAAFLGR